MPKEFALYGTRLVITDYYDAFNNLKKIFMSEMDVTSFLSNFYNCTGSETLDKIAVSYNERVSEQQLISRQIQTVNDKFQNSKKFIQRKQNDAAKKNLTSLVLGNDFLSDRHRQ